MTQQTPEVYSGDKVVQVVLPLETIKHYQTLANTNNCTLNEVLITTLGCALKNEEGNDMANIHTDTNGVTVAADMFAPNGINVEGHHYTIYSGSRETLLRFQKGGVALNGVNGITNEALLAVMIHRTKYLNEQFHCEENDQAIEHMQKALDVLELRTARRIARNVEGTDTK